MWWTQRLGELVTLFLVVNPFAALPTFLAIAAPLDPPAQRKIALGAAVISFAVLVFFVFAGAFLLQQMSISIRAFQISGGILLFVIALDMAAGRSKSGAEVAEQGQITLSIYPLAIPKLAGPGSMLTVVLLTDDDRFNLPGQLSTVGVLAGRHGPHLHRSARRPGRSRG